MVPYMGVVVLWVIWGGVGGNSYHTLFCGICVMIAYQTNGCGFLLPRCA